MKNPIIALAEKLKAQLRQINSTPSPYETNQLNMIEDIITLAEDQEDVRIKTFDQHASQSLKRIRDEVNTIKNGEGIIPVHVRAMRDEELLAEINKYDNNRTYILDCVKQLQKNNPKYRAIEINR